MALVSVIIPSYNHARYVSHAVASVLNQTLRDLELIVVDDGSTDNSLQILQTFSDDRMRVISQSNAGAHAAIDRGITASNGRYVAILNSDDVYALDRLAVLTECLKSSDAVGLVGTHVSIIDEAGRVAGNKAGYKDLNPWPLQRPELSFRSAPDLRAALLTENYFATTSNYLFPRVVFDQAGTFAPLRYVHDWDFALRVAQTHALMLVPRDLLSYRIHGRNTIRENRSAMVFEVCWILARHLPRHVQDPQWFETSPHALLDRLLESVYAFGCENVVIGMLAEGVAENDARAYELLDPLSGRRQSYVDYVSRRLAETQPAVSSRSFRKSLSDMARMLRGRLRG